MHSILIQFESKQDLLDGIQNCICGVSPWRCGCCFPSFEAKFRYMINICTVTGMRLYLKDKIPLALKAFERSLSRVCETGEHNILALNEKLSIAKLHRNISQCHLRLGNFERALESANEAKKYAPSWFKVYYQMCSIHMAVGNLCDASIAIQMSLDTFEGIHGMIVPIWLLECQSKLATQMDQQKGVDASIPSSLESLPLGNPTKDIDREVKSNAKSKIKKSKAKAKAKAKAKLLFSQSSPVSTLPETSVDEDCDSSEIDGHTGATAEESPQSDLNNQRITLSECPLPTAQHTAGCPQHGDDSVGLMKRPPTSAPDSCNSIPSTEDVVIIESDHAPSSAPTVAPTARIEISPSPDARPISPDASPPSSPCLKVALDQSNIEFYFIQNDRNWGRYVDYLERHGPDQAYRWALSTPSVAPLIQRFQRALAKVGFSVDLARAFMYENQSCVDDDACKAFQKQQPSCDSPNRYRKSWVDIMESDEESQ